MFAKMLKIGYNKTTYTAVKKWGVLMRRKVYTKDQILKAAYDVVAKEGFKGFTARNIAKRWGFRHSRFIWNSKTWKI